MQKYFFIATGGAIGALLRFELKTSSSLLLSSNLLSGFSYNILLINLFGCFLLGIMNAVFSKTDRISTDVKLGITAGFVGAFTTFSTFCKESLTILNTGYLNAFFYYIFASVVFGVIAVYIGHLVGHRVVHPFAKNVVSRFSYDYN